MKRSDAESVPVRASVHTRNAAFEAVSAPKQYCSSPLLKVKRSVSDRFSKWSESSLNTFQSIISLYIDDLISFNNKRFKEFISDIYPKELTISETTESTSVASYLDLLFIRG